MYKTYKDAKGIEYVVDRFGLPKKGEFFLSGAIPEVYKAPNDLTVKYWVLRRKNVKRKRS